MQTTRSPGVRVLYLVADRRGTLAWPAVPSERVGDVPLPLHRRALEHTGV
jgi:hypothetical protein